MWLWSDSTGMVKDLYCIKNSIYSTKLLWTQQLICILPEEFSKCLSYQQLMKLGNEQ